MSSDTAFDALVAAIPLLYLVLQIAALVVMRGGLRVAALVCATGMGAVLGFVLVATLIGGSNIAPVLVFLALPPATLAIVAIWLVHILRRRRPDTRYL